ncbi:hypothetical protein [Actinophytocola gossypii]|uniref:hypothetical protein n=1 Tax=Actinophytocola gossypii TaxID=2812003 RepID=UPI0021A727B6|nr:hypothetical protein [Actinophytocola gossypii]
MLLPNQVEPKGARRWILWPTLQYRVVAPLVHEQRLNMFQRAVLGLARAGVRDRTDIGRLLGLEPGLVGLVHADLRQLSYMDARGAVTLSGRAALKDGFLDPTRTIVTFVYQDPFTGTLWPASTTRPEYALVEWRHRLAVTVQLRTPGAPMSIRALPVPVPDDVHAAVEPPSHEQVVEAVGRGEKVNRRGEKARAWASPPPDRVVTRVSMINTGQPVYVPVELRLRRRTENGVESVSWVAHSPFTGRQSTYLRRLVATRALRWSALGTRIDEFVGQRSDALLVEYDQLDVALRQTLGESIERRFTPRLREHRYRYELLVLLERDISRLRLHSGRSPVLGDVVRNSWQLHESILREIVADHPVTEAAMRRIDEPLRPYLGECCRAIGLLYSQHEHLRVADPPAIRSALRKPRDAKTPPLLAAALISAVNGGANHPFRQLAAVRPKLLTQLTFLSGDRNKVSHADPVELNRASAETAWELAQEITAAYLGQPLPDLSGKDHVIHGEEEE